MNIIINEYIFKKLILEINRNSILYLIKLILNQEIIKINLIDNSLKNLYN